MPDRDLTAAFIDGANLYATTKALGFEMDFRKLHDFLTKEFDLLRVSYYTAVIEDQEYSSIRPLIDWLDYNGYRVVTKPAREFGDGSGARRIKGNLDIELAVDAMELAPRISEMILFSGDGDFRNLVAAMQRQGVRVTVVSTIQTKPHMVADELRRQADEFVDLSRLIARLGRDAGERNGRSQGAEALAWEGQGRPPQARDEG